jgi:hypothetical protein
MFAKQLRAVAILKMQAMFAKQLRAVALLKMQTMFAKRNRSFPSHEEGNIPAPHFAAVQVYRE